MTGYKAVLQWVLSHRVVSCAMLLGTLVAAVWGAQFIPPGFMPESQRPQFVVDVYLPQGSDIRRTEQVVASIRKTWRKKPVLPISLASSAVVACVLCSTYSPEARNPSYGQLLIDIDDYTKIAPLVGELQNELDAKYPDASIKVWKFMLGRGGGKKIEAGFNWTVMCCANWLNKPKQLCITTELDCGAR
uniref:efflux RND transporter permease subunit n=1 Tax=Vibrio cholerae TaxID=666 RepID=UPI003F58CB4B